MSRKHERVEIEQTITIEDVINGGKFGDLVNITVEGLMVLSERELNTHSIYQLSLSLPIEIEGSRNIVLGADCLWSKQADQPSRHWAGLQIIDASDTALLQIATLVENYGK